MTRAPHVSMLLLLGVWGLLGLGCARHSDHGRHVKAESTVDDAKERVPGSLVVDFKDGISEAQVVALGESWGVHLEFNSLEGAEDGVAVARDVGDLDGKLAVIRQSPWVEAAEPLMVVHADYVPNDPDFPKQWNLKMIHAPAAWERSRGKGVVVAVIDTGVAYEDYQDFREVPDLKGVKFVPGYNFIDKTTHANDDHRHGTHVAGTIAQATNNGEGVAGIAFEAALMPLKVLNHFGVGTSADIADAIRFAADHGAQVINLSLGGGGHSQVMENAVAHARKKGATVVCAAGNSGMGRVEYPGAYPGAIAVGAVGPTGARAPYSAYGKQLDLVAPGGDKRSGPEGGILQNTLDARDYTHSVYEALQGTSMAAPHVAGVAALLYAAGAKSPDEVEAALYAGARRTGQPEWSEEYGHGLVDAEGALKALGAVRATGTFAEPEPRWAPIAWGLGLLAAVLLTLGQRARPGFLNVLLWPKFLVPFLLASAGVYFLQPWLSAHGGPMGFAANFVTVPIPDWQRIIWGGGRAANPLFYSALIPVLGSLLAVPWRTLRPVVAGLSLGFAAFLAYAAWARAPALRYFPWQFLARPWLVLNALVCMGMARALLRKEAL